MPTIEFEGQQHQFPDDFSQADIAKALGSLPKREDVTAGMALRGVPVLGAYVPQAEAAIRAAAQPLTGVGQPGATYAERYAKNLPLRQADYARAEAESPVTSEALKFGGGMAALAPLGATALGARALGAVGPWAARIPLGAASGAGISAADAWARGQDPGEAAMWGGGLGAAAPVIGAAVQRAISPIGLARGGATRAGQVANLQGEGVRDLTAGEITGSRPLQYFEQSLGDVTGAGTRKVERGQEQFTRAVLRRAGIDAPRATQGVMDDAFTRIGNQFDNLAANNTLHPDAAMGSQLRTTIDNYNSIVAPPNRAPAIGNFEAEIATALARNGNTLPGNVYQSLRSRMETTARNAPSEVADTLRDMKNALDSSMERHLGRIGSSDLGAWQQARREYRNILPIERAVTAAGSDAATGLISPSALQRAVIEQSRRGFSRGHGDLSGLARSGEAVMRPLPQSGTAPRAYMMSLPASIGAMIGGTATGNPLLALGGAAGTFGPPFGGNLLMSRPIQRYLANRVAGPGAAQLGTVGTQALGNRFRQFAEGGRPDPYQPVLVGEQGPELFVPDQPGTVVPDPYEAAAARTRRRYPTRTPDPISLAASQGGAAGWGPMLQGQAGGMLTLPRRATQAAGDLQRTGQYDPAPAVEASLLSMGMPMLAGGTLPGLAAAGMYYPKLYGAAQRNAIQQGMRAGQDPQTVR